MDAVNLVAINTATFLYQRSLTSWAAQYALGGGKFRAHMRRSVDDPSILYEWSTDNRKLIYQQTAAVGSVTYGQNPAAGDTLVLGASAVTFVAPGPPIVIAPSATVTMTIAAPCAIMWPAHGLPAGTPVRFTTIGSFPTGIQNDGTTYFVSSANLTVGSFQICADQNDAVNGVNNIATSGSQFGAITATAPTTIIWPQNQLSTNTPIQFSTTQMLPAPLSAGPTYYVLASLLTANSFQIGFNPGGAPIYATGQQSGVQSIISGAQITLAPQEVVAITIGAPGIINWPAHQLPAGTPIVFGTSGNLPGPLTVGQIYYVSSAAITINSFTIAANQASALDGNADIAISGAQSGTQIVAAPTTVLWTAHGLSPNSPVEFQTTGELPAGVSSNILYFVIQPLIEANSFQIAAQAGGAPIIMSGTQSGIQTGVVASNQVRIGGSLALTMVNLLAFLSASQDPQISQCVYSAAGFTLTAKFGGPNPAAGNSFVIAASSVGASVSGSMLVGGGSALVMKAPWTDMQVFNGAFVYDCRWESGDGALQVYLFGGTITLNEGVTRSVDMTAPTLQLNEFSLASGLPIPIADGDTIICSDAGGGAAPLVSVNGLWTRMKESSFATRNITGGVVNLQPIADANVQRFALALTANLSVNLTNVLGYPGALFRIIAPPNLGGNTFSAGGVLLFGSQWIEFQFDENGLWQETGVGQVI